MFTRSHYNKLKEEEVSDACEELKAAIAHVQEKLKASSVLSNGKATVVRCLSRFQVLVVANQLSNLSLEWISMPVSIFSSYSYDGNLYSNYPSGRDGYDKHINIREEVPVDLIVLWDKYVGNGRSECPYVRSMFDCEKELWVLDKSITGIRKMPRSCFHYYNGLPKGKDWYPLYIDYGRDMPVHEGCYKKRPCQYEDFLTQICIKRNLRRMEQEDSI